MKKDQAPLPPVRTDVLPGRQGERRRYPEQDLTEHNGMSAIVFELSERQRVVISRYSLTTMQWEIQEDTIPSASGGIIVDKAAKQVPVTSEFVRVFLCEQRAGGNDEADVVEWAEILKVDGQKDERIYIPDFPYHLQTQLTTGKGQAHLTEIGVTPQNKLIEVVPVKVFNEKPMGIQIFLDTVTDPFNDRLSVKRINGEDEFTITSLNRSAGKNGDWQFPNLENFTTITVPVGTQ